MGGRAASAVAGELLRGGVSTALYDCLRHVDGEGEPRAGETDAVRASVCGRQFIEDTRRLRLSHEHVIVDLSEANDQIAAIAFSSADLILLPLQPNERDNGAFVKTTGLLDILSSHRSQPMQRVVFLVSGNHVSPCQHLQIAGLLIRRGLAILPISFREAYCNVASARPMPTAVPPSKVVDGGSARRTELSRFVKSVMDAVPKTSDFTTGRALFPV